MINKLQNNFAFICSKINIKTVFFVMIFIGTFFYVPPKDYMPSVFNYMFEYFRYLFIFIFFIFAIPALIKNGFKIPANKFIILPTLYIAVCVLSIILNIDNLTPWALDFFSYTFFNFTAFLAMIYLLKGDEHKILINAMIALIFFNSIFSYLNFFLGIGDSAGFFENKLPFGCTAVMVSAYLIIRFFNENSIIKKLLLFAGILFLFVNIILLLQRGLFLAYFFVVAVIVLGTKNKKTIVSGILLCCVLILFVLGYMSKHRTQNSIMYSDMGRAISIVAGFKMFIEKPIFGVGHGTAAFRTYKYEKFPFLNPGGEFAIGSFWVHNILVMQLAETGIVGFLFINIFTVMLLYALFKRFKGKKNIVKECPFELFYFIAICVYIMNGMFQPTIREGYHWYLFAGAVILLANKEEMCK